MTPALMDHRAQLDTPLPPDGLNKWEALRELACARNAYGLSDRDMTVLQALVSFHPDTVLGSGGAAPVVYPSNAAICERLNGMPCSTMRRHLSRLVGAGVIVRRDSPNGKRYARRVGDAKVAYGFDLSPLVLRHAEVCAHAEKIRAERDALKRMRETVSLMRRDLAGLVDWGRTERPDLPTWDIYEDLARLAARDLRRKLDHAALEALHARLFAALTEVRDLLEPQESVTKTAETSTSHARNEQHHQNSEKDSHVSEGADPDEGGNVTPLTGRKPNLEQEAQDDGPPAPSLPLRLVLSACPEIQSYAPHPVRHWHEFVAIAETVRPMTGISPTAWEEARRAMGPEQSAVVLAALLERFTEIRNPGGYLRHLTAKASEGAFSCGPMVMALLRRAA